VVEDNVVCLVVASKVELASWKTAPGVVETTLEELDSTTATARADEVAVVATAATGVVEEEATTAAAVDVEEDPEDPKLLEAVVDAPLLTSTLLTITTSPLSPVTLTSTVVVPNPEDCSKKL
jgi:hypothetical protein